MSSSAKRKVAIVACLRESQFAADEIEYNNAHRSYDYREEPPIESVVGENINGWLAHRAL